MEEGAEGGRLVAAVAVRGNYCGGRAKLLATVYAEALGDCLFVCWLAGWRCGGGGRGGGGEVGAGVGR